MSRPAVDRTYRLRQYGFGHRNRERVYVIRNELAADFEVWWGTKPLRIFPTFDEAIRWAHANATEAPDD